MKVINFEAPTSTLTISDGPATIRVLQRTRDLIVQAATEFGKIKQPEIAYEEKLIEADAKIQDRFRRLREERETCDERKMQNQIIQYAGERKILEINGLADAESEHKNQIDSVLQNLCDKMIVTMGSAVVKRSLQKIAAKDLKLYLPDSTLGDDEAAATERDLASIAELTGPDKPHGDRPMTDVPDLVDKRKRRISIDTQQHSAKKRQTNANFKGSNKQMAPTKEQNVSQVKISFSHEQCGQVIEPEISKRREEIVVAITPNDASVDAVASPASDQPDENLSLEAALPPSLEHTMTRDDEDRNRPENIVMVYVNDADNNPIGHITQVEPWNDKRVEMILREPILRPVKIRRGRLFKQKHLAAVSDRSDSKGVKIVSCMIQATGELMNQRCQHCEKNQGAFEDCIKLHNDLFPRCGNCEWSRQRCQAVSMVNAKSTPSTPSNGRSRIDRTPQRAVAKASSTVGQSAGSSPPRKLIVRLSLPNAFSHMQESPHASPEISSVNGKSPMPPSETLQNARATCREDQTAVQVGRSDDELHSEGFSDADSYSGAPVTENDWRILQIKTRFFMSDKSITQYWNWVEKGQYFEHQVLKETRPVQWGTLREPIDFNVYLKEIAEVRYNDIALRVQLIMRKENATLSTRDGARRGDVMVVFRTQRTVRRFVKFCRERSILIVKQKPEVMVDKWRSMESQLDLADHHDNTNQP